jgi:hypothetical protein
MEERAGPGEGGEAAEALAGFASSLAASLLKETMKEREGEEGVWAIPCSADCHSPGPHQPVGGPRCPAAGAGARLCWTPESPGSREGEGGGLQAASSTCRGLRAAANTPAVANNSDLLAHKSDLSGQQIAAEQHCQKEKPRGASHSDAESEAEPATEAAPPLRKVTSEPSVLAAEEAEEETGRRGHGRRTFLSYLGWREERQGGAREERPGGPRSLRKTLSSMFHLRRRRTAGGSPGEEGGRPRAGWRGGLEGLRRGRQPVPPCQRALPPTPPGGEEGPGPGSRPASPVSGEEAGGNIRDFAASIEKVKDHGWYWGPLSGGHFHSFLLKSTREMEQTK